MQSGFLYFEVLIFSLFRQHYMQFQSELVFVINCVFFGQYKQLWFKFFQQLSLLEEFQFILVVYLWMGIKLPVALVMQVVFCIFRYKLYNCIGGLMYYCWIFLFYSLVNDLVITTGYNEVVMSCSLYRNGFDSVIIRLFPPTLSTGQRESFGAHQGVL
eukprot:TRINITY_DN265_c1_g2_i2.p4 TRINITY_DN265_c1_g2~~TRINITY_DN265_c1_g2_i2.p4  ORF type:complete len:158 (+),score=0.21 TRINITY_DN265_c1_g2_i2:895-1368(+)